MSKYLIFLFLLQLWPSMAQAQGLGAGAKLDELITEALSNNPQLAAARQASSAARARIDQATSLDAPQAGVEFFQTPVKSFPNPIKDGMETDYYIQQMIPFPGTLAGMGKAAGNYADMAGQEYKALERKIIRDLKAAYYKLYFVEREIGINREIQDLLEELNRIASINYEVGKGDQAGILRIQTELSTLRIDELNLDKEKKVTMAMVNTILGRPAGSDIDPAEDIRQEIPPLSLHRLDSLALQTRPELRGMESNIKMNEAELFVSKRELFPEFMLRFMYKDMKMTGNDYWSTMIGFTVPQAFWSRAKYRAKVEESRINIQKAEEEYENMRNMVVFQVHEAFENLQANSKIIRYYQDNLLPQAEQTMQSTIAAYRAGTMDFLMAMDAVRMFFESRLDYQKGIMDCMVSLADLEQAVGTDMLRPAVKTD